MDGIEVPGPDLPQRRHVLEIGDVGRGLHHVPKSGTYAAQRGCQIGEHLRRLGLEAPAAHHRARAVIGDLPGDVRGTPVRAQFTRSLRDTRQSYRTLVMRYSLTAPRRDARELMARRALTFRARNPARPASGLSA